MLDHWPVETLRRVPGTPRSETELRLKKSDLDDARLTLRDAALIDALEVAARDLDKAPKSPGDLRRALLAWGLVAVGAALSIVFVGAPLLADQLAEMIPPESEQALGESLANDIVLNGIPALEIAPGACAAPAGLVALDKMTERLERVADSHVPLNVRVLNSPVVNAFALPGGQIFLMKGLLQSAGGPDEVAGVLAHEIGHVVALDPTRSALRGAASGVVVAYVLGDVVGGLAGAGLVSAVIDARYSREAEAGADRIAIDILSKADMPIGPFAEFFAQLRDEYGDGGSFMDSHPVNSEREAMVRRAASKDALSKFDLTLTAEEWSALRRICDSRG